MGLWVVTRGKKTGLHHLFRWCEERFHCGIAYLVLITNPRYQLRVFLRSRDIGKHRVL